MPTLTPSSDEVRVYEIAVMISPDLDQKSEAALLKEIDELMNEASAKLLFKDPWSKRGLAYPIKGHMEAKFVIYYYEMTPDRIREIDRQLRLMKGVLRHLVVIPPPKYEAISFEDMYQQWLKTRETAADVKRRKKEEKLQEKVTLQAKRVTKRKDAEKKEEVKPLQMEKLTAELEKLISDEDLKI